MKYIIFLPFILFLTLSCENEDLSKIYYIVNNEWVPNHPYIDYYIVLDFMKDNSYRIKEKAKTIETGRWELKKDSLLINWDTTESVVSFSYFSLCGNAIYYSPNLENIIEYYDRKAEDSLIITDTDIPILIDTVCNRKKIKNKSIIKCKMLKCTENELILQNCYEKLLFLKKL